MDLNSKINWTPGMEITAQTFIGLEQQIDYRQQIALRAALGNGQMGLLPGTAFDCHGVFVGSTYEIEHLQCTAILPSGRIINVEERAAIPIPLLLGDQYYLTITLGSGDTEFEKEGVAYLKPQYVYGIQTLEEVEKSDVMPLVRFWVSDGVFSMDPDYIPPSLVLSSNERFADYIERYIKALQTLTSHPNLAEGDGKRALLRYLFIFRSYSTQYSLQELVMLTQELAQAIDYFIVTPNETNSIAIPTPSKSDIQIWLDWVEDYMIGAVSILDKVVLSNEVIDYDALLAQAKQELYDKLHPELLEKLVMQTKEELHEEMQQLTDSLTTLVRDTLKTELSDQLSADMELRSTQLGNKLTEGMEQISADLQKSLYDKLFSDVYIGLYNVLYENEEDEFTPLI